MSVFIPFPQPMVIGQLRRRYKRFLADIVLPDGQEVVAHCANTGSMRGLTTPDSPALVWHTDDPKRKLKWSWKAVKANTGSWVGIDTGLPNRLVAEAIAADAVPGLEGATEIKREQKMGANSRVDVVARGVWGRAWVEVKNVTLVDTDDEDGQGRGVARFPDAVTARGRKHLVELAERVREGDRAMMVFVVQRDDAKVFAPADDIDHAYGESFREAVAVGVEVCVLSASVSAEGVRVVGTLPWHHSLDEAQGDA